MIYILLASFFYANVVFRIPIGSYSYVLASDIVSWFVIVSVVLLAMIRRLKIEGRFRPIDYYLLGLNLLMYVLLFQVYFEAQRVFSEFGRAAADTLRFSQYILTFFAVRSYMRTVRNPNRFLIWVLFLAVGVSLFGLISDVVLEIPRNYAGITRDTLRFPKEFSAFFTDNRACVSAYLLTGVGIGFGFLAQRRDVLQKVAIIGFLIPVILAIIFSRSRSGIIGLFVTMAAFIFYSVRYHGFNFKTLVSLILITAILGVTVFLSMTSKSVMERVQVGVNTDSDAGKSRESKIAVLSTKSRLANWKHSLEMVGDMSYHIFFGYGVNQQNAKIGLGGAHNNFLQVLIDLGVFGTLLFLLLLRQISRMLGPVPTDGRESTPNAMRLGIKCTFWGLLVTALTQETFYMAPAMANFFEFFLVLVAIVTSIPTIAPSVGKYNQLITTRQ